MATCQLYYFILMTETESPVEVSVSWPLTDGGRREGFLVTTEYGLATPLSEDLSTPYWCATRGEGQTDPLCLTFSTAAGTRKVGGCWTSGGGRAGAE